MRVLVTGAAGFFGSRALGVLGDDVEPLGLDHPDADRARLNALAPGARFVACDLFEPGALRRAIRETRPDVCVHLAWYAVPGKYLEDPKNLDHLAASLELGKALAEAGCRRLVTAGTCFEYDTAAGLLSETSTTAPRTLYAGTKLAMFHALSEASRTWGMQHCHARFFYQYGPWEAPNRLVSSLVGTLLSGAPAKTTSGEQVRDFLHIEDVARALAVLTRGDVTGVVNVGSGVPVRVRDVARAVAVACGRPELLEIGALPSREGDPAFVCAEASKLRALGWAPRFDLETGLADTVAWYRARGT